MLFFQEKFSFGRIFFEKTRISFPKTILCYFTPLLRVASQRERPTPHFFVATFLAKAAKSRKAMKGQTPMRMARASSVTRHNARRMTP